MVEHMPRGDRVGRDDHAQAAAEQVERRLRDADVRFEAAEDDRVGSRRCVDEAGKGVAAAAAEGCLWDRGRQEAGELGRRGAEALGVLLRDRGADVEQAGGTGEAKGPCEHAGSGRNGRDQPLLDVDERDERGGRVETHG